MYALRVKNLIKTYRNGVEALKGVDLDVHEGGFFGLIGSNGAGKTTMIGIITGLVNKTGGSIEVFGLDRERHLNRVKKHIGLVPQEFNFNMFEKVQDIIIAQAGYFGVPRSQAIRDSEFVLKRLGLWEKRDTVSRQLSGGMKRRLMIARALIHKPKLLFLDEPTAGVDVELRFSMWEYLKELNQSGMTIFLTTHYLEEAEQLCRNVAIIKNGKIIIHDHINNLLASLEEETYVIHVRDTNAVSLLENYQTRIIDTSTFEVDLNKKESLNDFIEQLSQKGIKLVDIRPKGNRLERLFLKLLKD